MKKSSLSVCALALSFMPTAFAEHRHAEAHVHGAGVLNMVLEKNVLSIELDIPLDSIVGFEHEAKTDADKKKLADVMGILKDAPGLFAVEGAGSCQVVAKEVELEKDDHKDKVEASKKDGKKAGKKAAHAEHADLEAEYTITCEKVDSFNAVQVKLFEFFPRIEKLTVNFVGGAGQKAGYLTKKSNTFSWK